MAFLLECPNCGKRNVGEFTYKGEYSPRPAPEADFAAWADYVFFRNNAKGRQIEWWYHSAGCQRWFLVTRNTTNNTDHQSFWFSDYKKAVQSGDSLPKTKKSRF